MCALARALDLRLDIFAGGVNRHTVRHWPRVHDHRIEISAALWAKCLGEDFTFLTNIYWADCQNKAEMQKRHPVMLYTCIINRHD